MNLLLINLCLCPHYSLHLIPSLFHKITYIFNKLFKHALFKLAVQMIQILRRPIQTRIFGHKHRIILIIRNTFIHMTRSIILEITKKSTRAELRCGRLVLMTPRQYHPEQTTHTHFHNPCDFHDTLPFHGLLIIISLCYP